MAEHGYLRKATPESTSAKSNHFLQPRPFDTGFDQDAASEREVDDLEAASNTTANSASASSSVGTPPSLPNNTFHFSNINVLQPKLTIGQPNDPLEQEADQVADEVMRKSHSGFTRTEDAGAGSGMPTFPKPHPLLMRQPVQRDGGIVSGAASDQFETQLSQSRGGGSPLELQFRGQLESAMGADLQNVKVHTDTKADQLSQSIQAKAFTTGSDIFFKQGEYSPNSRSGQELIAHEVTHTLQQGATQQVGDTAQRQTDDAVIQRNPDPALSFTTEVSSNSGGGNTSKYTKISNGVRDYNSLVDAYNEILANVRGNPEMLKQQKKENLADRQQLLEDITKNVTSFLKKRKDGIKSYGIFTGQDTRNKRQNKLDTVKTLNDELERVIQDLEQHQRLLEIGSGNDQVDDLDDDIELSESESEDDDMDDDPQEILIQITSNIQQIEQDFKNVDDIPLPPELDETEEAFENAPLQDNPQLAITEEREHVKNEVEYTVYQGTTVYFLSQGRPEQQANKIGETVQVQILTAVQGDLAQQYPNCSLVLFLGGENLQGRRAIVATKRIDEDTLGSSERFEKVDMELFPDDRDPDPNDVKQTNLGDCYLQAALASIATTRPQYIKQIMRDQGDTVTVRLHDVEPDSDTFTPRHVKVEKSIPKSASGKGLYNKGELWVKMIQKAYVAGGFTGSQDKDQQSLTPSYGDIDGGHSDHAFNVLLGKRSTSISLNNQGDNDLTDKTLNYINQAFEMSGLGTNGMACQTVVEMLLKKEAPRQNLDSGTGDIAVQLTLDEVAEAFKYGSLQEQTKKDTVLELLKPYLPGKLGTGHYTESQLGIFNQIQLAIEAKKPITISTHKFIEASNSGFNGFSGEQKKGGLAGRHAYSVMQVCTSDDISSPSLGKTDGKYKLIQLRNPWGEYGRGYEYDFQNIDEQDNVPVKAKSKKDGVFWIELSEVTKYFKELDFGAKIPTD